MAKYKKSLFRLQGTLSGLTFVDSAAYGAHTRLPRGTHKKAKLNPSFKTNTELIKPVTSVAKLLLPCYREIGDGFTQSDIWQQLMRPLFKPKDGRVAVMLKCLEGLELNSSYRLSSIVYPAPPLAISTKGNKCCITLQTTSMPSFPAKIKADGYYFEVYIVWLDGKTTKYEWESKQTEWLPVDHKRLEIALDFDKPSWAKYRVVMVKVQGGENEREIESFASMGMQVREGGKA